MHKIIFFFALLITPQFICAQQIIELANMPEKVSNNAVCQAKVGSETYVYSFAGIDETKGYAGIHKRAFRYSTNTDTWESMADLPSGDGRIAAGASVVKNKIYIIGGYEVFEDGFEISYDKVHVYDPETNEYLDDGAAIPVPIDDHVQAVWRDSLIYVVTGWSDEDNVPDVQIYDPSINQWSVGTSTPDNSTFKAFGASGVIIEDTIYYCGGVRNVNGNFASANAIRIGVINPTQPTEISWESNISSFTIGYRMAAAHFNESKPIWIGGGAAGYNFDGLAYSSGEGVDPLPRILEYTPEQDKFTVNNLPELQVMDLRGSAQLSPTNVIICGGMMSDQEVSDKTFMIDISLVPNEEVQKESIVNVSPNPSNGNFIVETLTEGILEIIAFDGALLRAFNLNKNQTTIISNLDQGIYFLVYRDNFGNSFTEKISIVK